MCRFALYLGAEISVSSLLTDPANSIIHQSFHSHEREEKFHREFISNKPALRVITGYVFHSWELLGLWAWMPAFLAAVLALSGAASMTAVTIGAYLSAGFHIVGFFASSLVFPPRSKSLRSGRESTSFAPFARFVSILFRRSIMRQYSFHSMMPRSYM